MKILKQSKWTHVFTCGGCKSELEAESDDVTYDVVGSFDDYTGRFQVKCPVCGDIHVLTTESIPAETNRRAVAAYYKPFPTKKVEEAGHECDCTPGQKYACICYTRK